MPAVSCWPQPAGLIALSGCPLGFSYSVRRLRRQSSAHVGEVAPPGIPAPVRGRLDDISQNLGHRFAHSAFCAGVKRVFDRGERLHQERLIDLCDVGALAGLAEGRLAGIAPADRLPAALFFIMVDLSAAPVFDDVTAVDNLRSAGPEAAGKHYVDVVVAASGSVPVPCVGFCDHFVTLRGEWVSSSFPQPRTGSIAVTA